ncbi:MAG TPA: aminotransferase class I/II-fold pyridoxal phosphate-dependent enzyme [bacterium]|nr:aminotransferase class I/II-fold pyridoxal phosphate-dependent enzyme [bacterium]
MSKIDFESMMSNRISKLPPYVFTTINKLKNEARMRGMDIIDLGMGSPDMPVPEPIRKELARAVNERHINRYPAGDGSIEFKRAVAYWYSKRFDVDLNPADEVLALIGSKEGLANLSSAFMNRDDYALIPTPTYPIFFNSITIFGGSLYNVPLLEENDFLPDFERIDPAVLRRAKLMFISYPHNPTTTVVEKSHFDGIARFAKEHRIIVSHDAAYSEICFDGYKAPSFLEAEGARDIGIEFHSFSKTFSMAGWRMAFVVGNPQILSVMKKMKSYVDFGVFSAIQKAAIVALEMHEEIVSETAAAYQRRRDILCDGLDKLGWKHRRPKATMYVWVKIPEAFKEMNSTEFASLIVRETGVAVAPGIGFGEAGNDHIRFALVEPEDRIQETVDRLSKL